VRTEAVAAAAARIIAAAQDLGQAVQEESRGGSSDAALAFDAGCPAVCGLGVVGGAIHTDREWIRISSLRERAALTAIVAARFLAG
jgi:glutamate carboxypeptidase